MEDQITYDNIIRTRERVLNDGRNVGYVELTEDAIDSITADSSIAKDDGSSHIDTGVHVAAMNVKKSDDNCIITENGHTYAIEVDS